MRVDFGGALDLLTQERANEAIVANASLIRGSITKRVPVKSGRLRGSLRIGKQRAGVRFEWRAPYAARQYWTNRSAQWVKEARDADGRRWGRAIARSLFKSQPED